MTHTGFSNESASAGKFYTFEEKNPCIGPMSINRLSLGSANCQTSGFLLLLDFARKCNFVESVFRCKNLKTPSINSLQENQSRLSYETTGNLFISVFLAGNHLYALPQCYKWPVFIDCQCLYLFQSFLHQVHLSPSEFIFSFSKRKTALVALRACLW